jgi:hypothetical protein
LARPSARAKAVILGCAHAKIAGRVVADRLGWRDPGFDLAPFAPGQFATAGTVWRNPFTAGEAV